MRINVVPISIDCPTASSLNGGELIRGIGNKRQNFKWVVGFILLISAVVAPAEDRKLTTKVDSVDVTLFIPEEAKPIRGLLVHVFNHEIKPHDRNSTMCRELGWAHINTVISRKENNRPAKIQAAIAKSLEQFAAESGNPELLTVPRAGTGFSAGGMVVKVLEAEPELLLTNAVSCSWVSDSSKMPAEAAAVPHLFLIGAKPDGFKMLPAIEKFYDPALTAKLPWGLGLQHDCAHDWANSGTLIMPWIRAIAELRMTPEGKLRDIAFESGWRGDRRTINGTYAAIVPAAESNIPSDAAVWLPNREVAFVWRAWQSKKSPVSLTAKVKGGMKELGTFNPKKSFGMSVGPGTEITLGVKVPENFPVTAVRFFDGDKLIGTVEKEPWEMDWSHPGIGCRAVWAEFDGKDGIGAANPALFSFEPGE